MNYVGMMGKVLSFLKKISTCGILLYGIIKTFIIKCVRYKSFKKCTNIASLLFLAILCCPDTMWAQNYDSKNNYTGDWMNPLTWIPTWENPQTYNDADTFDIHGFISHSGDLRFNNEVLNIYDTLLIFGNLTIEDNCKLEIKDEAILIVYGDFNINGSANSEVKAESYFIASGKLSNTGSPNGEFTSNDEPPLVFLGSVIWENLTNITNYPVLNCSAPSIPYPNSGCSFGNMADLEENSIYNFYLSNLPDSAIILSHPSDASTCISLNTDMFVSAENVAVYQWQLDKGSGFENIVSDVDYLGKNSNQLTIVAPDNTYHGYLYRCMIVGTKADTIYTNEAALNVYEPIVANPGAGGSSCNLTFNLNATLYSGIGTWSKKNGPGGVTFSPDSANPNAIVTVQDYGTYEFTWTESNGVCPESDSTIAVIFFEQPMADAGNGGDTSGLSFSLAANTSAGNGSWSLQSGEGSVLSWSNGQDSSITTATVNAFGEYIFRWTETNGPCSDFDEITVNFIGKFVAEPGMGGTSCGTEFNLAAKLNYGTGYWSQAEGPGTSVFLPDSATPDATVMVNEYGNYKFTWTEVFESVTDDSMISVTFYEPPLMDKFDDDETCGLEYLLNTTLTIENLGLRMISGYGESVFEQETEWIKITVDQPGVYMYMTYGENEICKDSSLFSIQYLEIPEADAGPDQELFNVDEVSIAGLPGDAETAFWEIISGSGTIVSRNSPETEIINLGDGETILRWTVSNDGCESSDELIIKVSEQIIPTFITPNGDFTNDFFEIQGIEENGSVKFLVFNRWGKEVFSSPDYKNNWEGNDKNGTKLPDGTYYYIVEFANKKIIKNYVLIQR